MKLRFSKMHGIGNDFVVVDARTQPFTLSPAQIAKVGDRHFGVGFDQLLTIEPARDPHSAFRYDIYNTDGTKAQQCGNGVRCVAAWLHRANVLGVGVTRLQSPSGPIGVEVLADGRIRAEMGVPSFAPETIPFLTERPAASYHLHEHGTDVEFGVVSMGNPHAVIEVADVTRAPLNTVGGALSASGQFPEGCNVGVVQVLDREHVRLRVWERGVGPTLACGSGACAAVAVLHRRGKLDREVQVELPGGMLEIRWDGEGSTVWMTGPAAFVFEGEIEI